MELESVPYNIRREVDSVFYLFDDKAQQKSVEMSMLVHGTVPTCVVGDPGRFRQVLIYLLFMWKLSIGHYIELLGLGFRHSWNITEVQTVGLLVLNDLGLEERIFEVT